ncbi:heterokaryon incompatibility protein-domain-containing protein [Hypomontagnella submonticulosa]|nr:heterokaryon incompatibility protein-domain-containing protein [Hypomontagnella submonticulosa]
MKRLFNRLRGRDKEPAKDVSPPARTSFRPQASPGTHVCTSLCDGIASLPPEYHESVIAQLSTALGQTPGELTISSITLKNPRIVPEETRDIESELEERRNIEGNVNLARMPLALPTTYKYPPLPKGHARFLRLGGLGPHPLAYLESHSLENPPPYIAISYCWDPSSARRAMFLDSNSFSVSETVLEVLNQVQASQHATNTKQLLWIDQICINQGDPDEKLDQIYRMGEIYSKAEKVFIWLGPTANNSDVALENMGRMLDEVLAINQAILSRQDIPDDTVAVINADHGKMYGHLLSRQWFRRLWTVQEALLARKLVVMCGYREVDFELLVELAYQLLMYGSMDLIQPPGISGEELSTVITGVFNLNALRLPTASPDEVLKGLEMDKFRSLVTEARSRQVTMPDDRVFALMGVAPRQVRESMAAVTGKVPTFQLYAHFTKCMLENDPEWYFLSSAPSKDGPSSLPSWVPNLNSQQPFASNFAQASYGFSAGISPETRHLISRSITTQELTARGFRLGTVEEIIPQIAFTEENQNMKLHEICGDATREWDQNSTRLCQELYQLGPEQFPTFHVNILQAQSAAKPPPLDGRALEAYHLFWTCCRLRNESLRMINQQGYVIPEHYRNLPDGVDRFADRAVTVWRNDLSPDDYGLLLGFTSTMKLACSGRPYMCTDTGRLGLGCPGVQVGDIVCILYGTTVPYVLRQRSDGSMEFVGDAYIYNAMNGEWLVQRDGKGPDEIFRIR